MKVLLIQPSQELVIGKKKKNGSIMPPLGLLILAACIRKECKGTQVDFYDYEVDNNGSVPDFALYDIVALSATSVHIPHAYHLILEIRNKNSNACIIIGGAHATFDYESLLNKINELDAVIIGEGELSLTYFINHYTNREHLPEFPGIVTRNTPKNAIRMSPIVADLDMLPEYAYDLVDMNKYQLSTHRKSLPVPFISYITSRGCPFSCKYCQTPSMFGRHIRYRSPKLVFQEFLKLKDLFGFNSVVFWDDTFTSSRKYTIELCSYLESLNISWMCNTRVDCVDEDLLIIMKRAGCKVIFFGVESFDEKTLRFLDRTTTEEKVRNAFSMCRSVGIKTVAALMIGAPYDTLTSIEINTEKLKSLSPDDVYISIYNAVVGSKEYKLAIKRGDLDDDIDWINPIRFGGPPFGLPTVHPNLGRFQLQILQKGVYESFYGKGNEEQYE